MSVPIPEPGGNSIALTNSMALAGLIGCYMFGVWLRSFVFPVDSNMAVWRQLLAAIPVGFITMGLYAKSALPPLLQSADMSSDAAISIGYAIVLGMLSRETLDKMLRSTTPPNLPGGH